MPDQKEIISTIAEYLGISLTDIDRSSDLREDLGLGIIELNDLVSKLSQHFQITFDSEEVAGLQTVDDLIVLIEDNLL